MGEDEGSQKLIEEMSSVPGHRRVLTTAQQRQRSSSNVGINVVWYSAQLSNSQGGTACMMPCSVTWQDLEDMLFHNVP